VISVSWRPSIVRSRLRLSWLIALSWCIAPVAGAQAPSGHDAGGLWALGLAGQVDEYSNDSLLGTVNWGVTADTWLSFSAGRSTSPADRADVRADTLLAAVDHRFETVGFSFEIERWGDPESLETDDLRGTVYIQRLDWRIAFRYGSRDIHIPFTLTGPLGGTLQRTARVGADSYGLDARVSLAERWRLYLGFTEHGYERDLALLPRIDRLNLLSTSTLTLANSFLDHERSIGVERDLGRTLLNVAFTTDQSAIDGSSFDTLEVGVLIPMARRIDLEIDVGHGRSELAESGWYGGLLFLLYGGR
jgi:hypothetical protein